MVGNGAGTLVGEERRSTRRRVAAVAPTGFYQIQTTVGSRNNSTLTMASCHSPIPRQTAQELPHWADARNCNRFLHALSR